MKKIMIFIILGICAISFVNADITPGNSHSLEKCVEIVNLNEFSEISFFGYITGPMIEEDEICLIEPNTCLTIRYKFNDLKIFAAEKSYVDSVGIKNINVSSENVLFSDEQISPYGGYVDESDPLIKIKVEYFIFGFSENKLVLYKSQETSQYNNAREDKIEVFEKPNIQNLRLTIVEDVNPEPISEPIPEPKSFWDKISCFFRGIFSKSC